MNRRRIRVKWTVNIADYKIPHDNYGDRSIDGCPSFLGVDADFGATLDVARAGTEELDKSCGTGSSALFPDIWRYADGNADAERDAGDSDGGAVGAADCGAAGVFSSRV